MGNPLSLSNCRELRELKISALRPGIVVLNLISSITSTNIKRIVFVEPQESLESDHPNWAELGNLLCRLGDRSECGPRLEVEFQALDVQGRRSGKLGFGKHLPRFCEKGGWVKCGFFWPFGGHEGGHN